MFVYFFVFNNEKNAFKIGVRSKKKQRDDSLKTKNMNKYGRFRFK